jgi:hypothetical protein
MEVKLSAVVGDDDVKNLLWLKQQIGNDLLDALVINTGPQAYRRQDGVAVVPAALIGARVANAECCSCAALST